MSLLASLGSAVANAIGPAISTAGALYVNHQNLKNQDYWNNYQIELANTAHQREVADLEAAGLNPILSAGGTGSSTPSLHAATIDNPLSSFGTNAKAIGDSLTGKINAEVDQAKADAASSKSYAKRADELLDVQLAKSQFERDEAEYNANIAFAEASDYLYRGVSKQLESAARMEALSGSQPAHVGEVIGDSKEGWKTYNDLVRQYRNEIETGRYHSSLGRAVFNDVVDTVSSAGRLNSRVPSRRPSKRRSFSLSDDFKDFMEDVYRNGADTEYTTPQGKEWY